MRNNLPFLWKTFLEEVERQRDSRIGHLASSAAEQVRTLKDYLPTHLGNGDAGRSLSPVELVKLYSQLSSEEKERISEAIRVAASGAPSTLEAFTPLARNPTHRAVGRLIFEDDGPEGPRPLHHVLVELWDRDFGSDDILGRTETNANGEFEIWYDPDDAGKFDSPDLELRVFELSHIFTKGRMSTTQELVYSFQGDDDVTIQTYDFGDLRVPYWEYDETKAIPRLLVVDYSSPPQGFSPGRALVVHKELKWLVAVNEKHNMLNQVNPMQPSIDEIQADYPENRTIELGVEHTRSDEYFGDRILNGMNASVLDRDPSDANRFWIHMHWNSYQQNDDFAAPNVDVFLDFNERGKLVPVEIHVVYRKRGHKEAGAPTEPRQVYKPDDLGPEQWLQAKRIARVSTALHAELDVHLAQTHFNVEQYAIAAYRNLRKSPLRQLLIPHVKEVVVINHEADRRLLGKNGFIARTQALTSAALDERIAQTMGTLDWRDWKPRREYCRQHTFGIAANAFWAALEEYVGKFFEDAKDEIVQHWYEVHRFALDLVEHSAPLHVCRYLKEALLDESGRFRSEGTDWYERNERMNLDLPRHEVGGVKKAVSLITATDAPGEEDLENMQQVCRYVIYHATFFHFWANSHQMDDGGELRYGGLGMRYGENGLMTPESDDSVLPPPEVASEQLWFANVLTKTRFGFIMSNEDRDIDPRLIEALRSRKKGFDALDVDIRQISSRPNI